MPRLESHKEADHSIAGKGTASTEALKHEGLGVIRSKGEQDGELGSGGVSDMIVRVWPGPHREFFKPL